MLHVLHLFTSLIGPCYSGNNFPWHMARKRNRTPGYARQLMCHANRPAITTLKDGAARR